MKSFVKLLLFTFFWSVQIYAQPTDFSLSDFTTSGDARIAGEECFQLTAPVVWQGGTVWYKEPIDLQQPFEMELNLFFGCDDGGADGMVFIFHPKIRDGFQGEGMGFGGLKPALGIEMDTYANPHLDDPVFDHMAVLKNGYMHHARSVSKTVSLLPGNRNIEDCNPHLVNISWNPTTQYLHIFVDGSNRLSLRYDIIKNIFGGQSTVFWGISSATGDMYNSHKVCIEKLEFSKVIAYDAATQESIKSGEDYTLEGVDFLSGKTDLQSSSFKELDKLAALLKASPEYHIYIKGHTDDVGSASSNKAISQKRADAVKDYLIKKGVPKDRIKSVGLGESTPKFKNNSPENRLKNRRVDILLVVPKA